LSNLSCRFCGTNLDWDFVDLGSTPLANSYLTAQDIEEGRDARHPLHARVCPSCYLVQVDEPVSREAIFSDYAYFSSYSDSWVEHARRYADAMIARFHLTKDSLVAEIASNDGYLLQHFVAAGIPVLGIEPAANVAAEARRRGVPTEVAFFGVDTARRLAERGVRADLTAANNVLAHVPRIGDFVEGFAILLKPQGVSTFEFPHLLNLIQEVQFDTIYHEHFSYLSLLAVENVLARANLRAFDVEKLPTHGGSLRLFVCHADANYSESERLAELRALERANGLDRLEGYQGFASEVAKVCDGFLAFLKKAKEEGKTVAAYGAAAKGNTFLNVCGVTTQDIVAVFDRSTAKQGRFLPGSHIPVLSPDAITEIRPDYLVVLPWNLLDEITQQMAVIREWGGRFVTAVPNIEIH
jgi:SAM-dependent methyltransferase